MREQLSLDLEISASGHAEGYIHTIVLARELDMTTVGELTSLVKKLLAEGASDLVLDIGGLTFIDNTGLRGILTIRELCQRHGAEFGVTLGQKNVQRLFEVTGLDNVLPLRQPQEGRRNARESYLDGIGALEGMVGEYLSGVEPSQG